MQKLYRTLLLTLLTAASTSLAAAPVGYSINSDSGSDDHDGLYRIDLLTGAEIERIGRVQSLLTTKLDVEGLAFAPDGTLYGIDDDTLKLFPINTDNAVIDHKNEVGIKELTAGSNDFGMTFACDEQLYVTSVSEQSLYRMNLDGTVQRIGDPGSLKVNISALAAYGSSVELYGLGNGVGAASRNLYKIDVSDGTTTLVGALGIGEYAEGGLAFDDSGQLWAITDRRPLFLPSQVMKVSTVDGAASEINDTSEEGFESLAITVPRGCGTTGNGETARFSVQKSFIDGNDVTPVTLNIKCNSGLILEQSITVLPNQGVFGTYEAEFVIEGFTDGFPTCEIWEDTPSAYTATYECFSENECSVTAGACKFDGVNTGKENLCLIRNYVAPVGITVTKQWEYFQEGSEVLEKAGVDLYCANVFDGDGTPAGNNLMSWSWTFSGTTDSRLATVYPDYEGATQCWTVERPIISAAESESTCSEPVDVNIGDGALTCTVTNTVFFEGIPTLSQYGLLLFSALMLLTGMVAVRRF